MGGGQPNPATKISIAHQPPGKGHADPIPGLRILHPPGLGHREAFLALFEDYHAGGEKAWCGENASALIDFDAYVAHLRDEATGIGISPEWAPTSHFWMSAGGVLVGTLRIRHHLTPAVEKRAGHIGYDIAPSFQNKGLGHEILRLGILEARKLGIGEILVICEASNLPSRKIIEAASATLAKQEAGEIWFRIPLS